MKFNIIILLFIFFSCKNSIKNGVYILSSNELYLYYSTKKITLSNGFHYPNCLFRVIKTKKIDKNNFYYIEGLLTNYKLGVFNKNELIIDKNNNAYNLWKIIKIDKIHFIIKSIDNCFIKIIGSRVLCDFIYNNNTAKFKLIKLFSELKNNNNKYNGKILNKEPIDILIKYIDLRDPFLKRNGIHQIEKDFDNEELRYSIRSILSNIPWIRKIFILMPNKKVRYFKEYNIIKDKIIYVKDKDLLGYESSNFNAFLFRYWKMKKFGISNNIIIMDDDYFIGKKLKKSDFFYVDKGKVVPAIVTSHFVEIDNTSVEKYKNIYEIKAKSTKDEQNGDIFEYVKYLTFSFILKIFNITDNEHLFIPKFTHNAIPVNLENIKEIYKLVFHSKYRYTTMDCLFRHYEYIQFQLLFQAYTFIKYKRKINNIPSKFIQLNNSISEEYGYSLFCLNKGAGNYSYLNFYNAKILMEYLFPKPSYYEIVDHSLINISFNIAKSLDKFIFLHEKEKYGTLKYNQFGNFFFQLIILFILLIVFKMFYNLIL